MKGDNNMDEDDKYGFNDGKEGDGADGINISE